MSAALSFHCMICFDQFDTDKKYPVVLPCGHTYICVECASRIDKCMECRATLFAPDIEASKEVQQSANQNVITSRWDIYEQRRRARAYTSYSNQSPQQSTVKKIPKKKTRLPLPKNVVLLSLIEASDLAKQTTRQLGNANGTVPSLSSSDEDEEMEQNKILMSMDLATSSCGTYAVAKKSGLVIKPKMNEIGHKSVRRLFGDEKMLNTSMKRKINTFPDFMKTGSKEMHLNYGDRVQVVTIVNNWAKLARGYGYVHIEDSNDLVKVGGVFDKACNIESMLYILSFRRNHLIDQKEGIERDAIKLMQELQDSIIENEDLTVIGAEAFKDKNKITSGDDNLRDDKIPTKPASPKKCEDSNSGDENVISQHETTGSASKDSPEPNLFTSIDTTFSNNFMTWLGGFFNSNSAEDESRSTISTIFSREDEQNYQTLLASAESWRRRNGREAERGVDLRTGRSGHLGANGHYASNHGYHDVGSFKISTHSGLTPNRRLRKQGTRQQHGSDRLYSDY